MTNDDVTLDKGDDAPSDGFQALVQAMGVLHREGERETIRSQMTDTQPVGLRELALAKTRLEEAVMWHQTFDNLKTIAGVG
jgi:hypothetical protein